MFCTACGNELQPATASCSRCGRPTVPQPASDRPSSRSKGFVAAILGFGSAVLVCAVAAAVLITTGVVSIGDTTQRWEGSGFATPEAAVDAYTSALMNSDVEAMVQAFAIESYAEHYDLRAFIERIGGYTPGSDQALPLGAVNTGLNTRARLGSVTQQIGWQYRALSDPGFELDRVLGAAEAGGADALYATLQATFDGSAFAGVRSASPVSLETAFPQTVEKYTGPEFDTFLATVQRTMGADELATRIARLETDDGDYFLVFEMVRYQDTWWIGSFSGTVAALAGIDLYSGGVVKA